MVLGGALGALGADSIGGSLSRRSGSAGRLAVGVVGVTDVPGAAAGPGSAVGWPLVGVAGSIGTTGTSEVGSGSLGSGAAGGVGLTGSGRGSTGAGTTAGGGPAGVTSRSEGRSSSITSTATSAPTKAAKISAPSSAVRLATSIPGGRFSVELADLSMRKLSLERERGILPSERERCDGASVRPVRLEGLGRPSPERLRMPLSPGFFSLLSAAARSV